jgi:hypothetical protein
MLVSGICATVSPSPAAAAAAAASAATSAPAALTGAQHPVDMCSLTLSRSGGARGRWR